MSDKKKLELDHGPQSARLPLGNEVDFEGEGEPIELDLSREPRPRAPVLRPSRAAVVRKKRTVWPILLLLVLGGAAGAGVIFRDRIDSFVHAEERALLTRKTIDNTQEAFGADTLDRGNDALALVDAAVARAPRYKPLLGWAAYTIFAHELRFGRNQARHDRAVAHLALAGDHPLASAAGDLLQNNRPRARVTLARALRDVDALLLLGALELADKHHRDAVAAFEEAARLESNPRTRAALLRVLESVDASRAMSMARELAKDAPAHVGARLVLGRLAIASRDVGTATKCVTELQPLEKSATRMEQSELETLRALVAIEHGDFAGAEHLLDRSSKLAEGVPSVWTLIALGDVSLHAGKTEAAHAHYDAALAVDPSVTRALLGLTRALIASGKYDEARKLLDTIGDKTVTAEVAKLRAITTSKASKAK